MKVWTRGPQHPSWPGPCSGHSESQIEARARPPPTCLPPHEASGPVSPWPRPWPQSPAASGRSEVPAQVRSGRLWEIGAVPAGSTLGAAKKSLALERACPEVRFNKRTGRINSITQFYFTASPELNSNCRCRAHVINRRDFRAGRPGDCLTTPSSCGKCQRSFPSARGASEQPQREAGRGAAPLGPAGHARRGVVPSKKPPHRTRSRRGPLPSLTPSSPLSTNVYRVPKTYQAMRDTHTHTSWL